MIWAIRIAQLSVTGLIAYCTVRNLKAAAPLAPEEKPDV